MNLNGTLRFAYIDELNCDLLELPYADRNIAMVILLPKEDYSIRDVEEKMKRFDTRKFEPRLSANSFTEVEIQMPRFEVSFDWDKASEYIMEDGVQSLFSESKADLGEISDDQLYVTKVNELQSNFDAPSAHRGEHCPRNNLL